jgi:hypothetical protein
MLVLLFALSCRRHEAPRLSRGFDPSLSGKAETLTAAQQHKLQLLVSPPPPAGHFSERRLSAGSVLDIYVDERLERKMNAAELDEAKPLAQLVGPVRPRSVLAHARAAELWLSADEVGKIGVRLNRKGAVKLEPTGQAQGGGGGQRAPGSGVHELRDVEWLEVRTVASARLPDEPR